MTELTTIHPRTAIALSAAAAIGSIANAARMAFTDREEAIQALSVAAIAGEHVILLGPPGTGKSSLIRYFAAGMGQSFFRILLNPDTQRDDLVGPIDPTKLAHGVWDRAWCGLATARMVFLDEVGKASGQVVNMTLDAMEERLVTSAGQDKQINLHMLAGATNETLGDDLEAAWDRFTLRVQVGRIRNSNDLLRMMQGGMDPPPVRHISDGELSAMREECHEMALRMTKAVKVAVVKLWSNISNVSNLPVPVTDRRWKRMMVVAAAQALLEGRTEIGVMDLLVARHVLWSDIEERDKIQTFVNDTIDVEQAEIRAKSQMVRDLVKDGENALGLEAKSRLNLRVDKMLKDLSTRTGRKEWNEMRATLEHLKADLVKI